MQRSAPLYIAIIATFFIYNLFFVEKVFSATGILNQINFQGKVVNKTAGTNISDGTYSFVFSIYSVSSGGAAIWTETKNLTVTNGIFQTLLGDTTSLPGSIDFNTDNLYLGINFNSDGEMSPRVRFSAVPYAFNAKKVAGLTVTDTTGTLTIPNSKTVSFGGAFTTSGANDVTLTTSGTTTLTLPTTGTLATLAGTEVLTNKSIGSTGLTFSGATTDITTGTNEDMTITANGTGDIVFTTDADTTFTISNLNCTGNTNGGALTADATGLVTCSDDDTGTWTLAGDSGSSQTISSSDTASIVGGTNGIDTVASATDTLTLDIDTTEIGTTTFGSGSDFTWTFNSSGATDPTLLFGNGSISPTLTATGLFNVLTGNLKVGNGAPSVTLNGEDAYVEGTFEADGASRFDGAVTTNSTLTAAGTTSVTAVNAASGSANALTLSGTLGIFNGSDTFRGLYLNYTNANHTSTSNVFNGVDIAAITGDADATETAVAIGSGWDNVLTVNGTTVINGSGQLTASQLTGTLISTNSDSGSSTLIQGDTLAINGGTNGIDTVLSGDTYTLNIDTTEIGTTTFGSGTAITQTFDASGGTDVTTAYGDGSITSTLSAAGLFNVLTGNLKVGNGTPTLTQDGEDAYVEGTFEADGASRFDGAVTTNSTLTAAGTTSVTAVNAASGSANALTLSGTLGIFNGSDTFRGLYLNYTNANHTSTSNVFNGVDIAAITGDADATETAVAIGSGWDNVLTVNGTTVINGSGQLTASQLTGTLISTNSDSGSSTLIQGDTLAINGGTNGIDTVLSGDTYTLNIDTTEIGTTTFGSGSAMTWTFNASGGTDTTIAYGDGSITNTLSATGLFNVLTGNLKVGNGTPTLTQNGEDAYVEGVLEVDGVSTFEGNVGIGTTNPSQKLEVVGNILTSGTVSTTVGGAAGAGTQALASNLYIQSRGMNLITNGSGLLGNNYNFTSFTFDQSDTHGGKGSFKNSTYSATVLSDELLPIDGDKYYKLSLWAKSTVHAVGSRAYFGVVTYDIDGNQIVPYTYMKFTGATDTTLAAQLNPGDTTVTLTDATGWQNATGAGGYQRNFIWYGYTNSFGYTYPDYTYSRNVSNNYSDFNTNGAWAAGGISGNVITLRAAWTGPTVPAGTAVRNNTSGGTYKYIAASNVDVPDTWTQYTGLIGGWDTTGANSPNLFPYGSSYVKLLFLLNRNVAGNTTNVSDLWFSELTANNIEVATTTQQGVVSTTTQSFAGDKTFTGVNAASGSANALTLSGTLGAFNGSDTFRGLYLNYTNANHTSTSNVFNGVDIAAITGDADATETAVAIGSGWDNVLTVNGTTVINGSGQIVSTQITGTIFNTSADSGSSTLVQNDTFAINGGTNGIDTVLSGDTYTLNLDTTEIGASTFGSGTPYTWVFDAGATDPTISFGDNSIAIASAVLSVNTLSLTGTGTLNGLDAIDATGETTLEAALDIAGDVTGTGLGAVTVAKINGATLGTTTATAGNLLIGSGTDWVSTALSGDITVDSAGVTSVAADSLNFADFVDAMALDANTTIAANHINTLTMTSTLTSGRTTYPMIISQANDATNNNSVGLLQLSNSDTASTAAVLNITQAATSGTGINFTSLTGGNSITVANTSGNAINANTITSGTGLTTTALTSGQAVVAGLPNGATTASAVSVTSSAAGITANYTGAVINIAPTRTMTAAATRDESGNYLKIARNVVTTGASSVYNITGALATFTNTGTQTAGTLTDSSNILNLAQNYASASGTVLNITGAGTGNLASLDASNSSANGVLIDVQSSSASQYAFRVTSNNASTQALSITGAGNVGIGTTAPAGKLDVTDTSNTAASFSLTNNTATTIGNGANTLGVLDLQSTTLTTGNFLNMELNALTTGKGINLTSTSTTLTSGNLVNLYWNPGSSATSTGDLFKINVGANALTNGNLFALYNNGTELFSVDTTKITSALPHEFTAAGDVSFAYDSIYTNQTASQIEAYGPLTIISGEVSESLDLTLKSYGTGAIVVDNSALELYTGEKLVFDTNDTGDSYLSHSNGGNYTSIFTDGVEVARFMADGSVDGNTTFDANQFDIAEYYPTIDPTVEAGDVVSLVSDLNETDLETSSYLIAKADPSVQNNVLGVISTKPGFSMGGGSFRSEFCALVLSGEEGENKARKDLFMKEIKESLLKGEFIVEGLDINSIEVDNEVAKLYDEYISTLEDGSISLNIPETRLATIEDRISSCKAEKQIPVALAGRVPVKIDTSNGAIKAGDLLAPSINSVGKAMKATAEGWVIGRALENHKEGNDTVMVYVFTSWYGGDSSSVIDNSQSLSLDGALKNMLSVSISADGKQNLGVAGNITSIGSVNSFNLTATGSVNAGLIRIDAMQNSISALGNKLYLQKENGSLDIDIFNGKLVMSPDGSLVSASTIQAKAVSSNEFKVLGAKSNGQDSSIGADILPAGKTSVVIENAYVKTNSKVFVTPTTRTDGQVLFIESKQDGKFTVVIESSVSKDIKFDYWIVQTEE